MPSCSKARDDRRAGEERRSVAGRLRLDQRGARAARQRGLVTATHRNAPEAWQRLVGLPAPVLQRRQPRPASQPAQSGAIGSVVLLARGATHAAKTFLLGRRADERSSQDQAAAVDDGVFVAAGGPAASVLEAVEGGFDDVPAAVGGLVVAHRSSAGRSAACLPPPLNAVDRSGRIQGRSGRRRRSLRARSGVSMQAILPPGWRESTKPHKPAIAGVETFGHMI